MKKLIALMAVVLFALSGTAVFAAEEQQKEGMTKPATTKVGKKGKTGVKKAAAEGEKKDGEAKPAAERKESPKK
jgi:hypothetical protein